MVEYLRPKAEGTRGCFKQPEAAQRPKVPAVMFKIV